jgi:hypothetical protein
VVCDFQQYLLGGLYRSRSDFNHDLNLTTADVGIINSIASGQTSSESGTRCDGVPVGPIHAEDGGLDVAWTRCISDGGTSLKIDDCAPTPSPPTHRLVFSVVAPSGITNLAGFQAEVVITSRDTQTPLPAFWRFDSCKTSNALQSTSLCENLDVSLNSNKTYPWMGPYAERIIVTGTLGSPQDLVAGQEYGLFDLTRQGVGTTGTQCAGCQQPVQVVLRSLRLQHTTGCAEPQAASHAALADPPLDVLVDGRATSNHAFWQEAWTDVGNGPLSSSMSMRRASSSLGALVVDFVLPTAAPAALEVFDAAGRRLRSLSLGAMTAGPHRLGLAGSGEWAAGAYFVRLRQGAVARSITVTILP